jgi:hypothetical protein
MVFPHRLVSLLSGNGKYRSKWLPGAKTEAMSNEAGSTPATVTGSSLMVSARPTIPASEPNLRSHRPWLNSTALTSLLGDGPLALGYDVATTERGTSNPSSVSVMEDLKPKSPVRLLIAWKSSDPEVAIGLLRVILEDIAAAGKRARRLVIDSSNEKFHARTVRKRLASLVAVSLVAGGEKISWQGDSMDAKTLLGNLWINALDDGAALLPAGDWIAEDQRLVKREAGSFATATGKNGEHGDTFDACKLAWWGLRRGAGNARGVSAVKVGTGGGPAPSRPVDSDRTSQIMAAFRRQSGGQNKLLA